MTSEFSIVSAAFHIAFFSKFSISSSMQRILFVIFICLSIHSLAQNFTLQGDAFDEKGAPLAFATTALLKPADSTMAFFAITNGNGHFEIKNVRQGNYLLQISFIGLETYYKEVKIPYGKDNNLGAFMIKTLPVSLKEVQIMGEYVPLWIKGDTLEYNAAAFKTKPDAVAEDLLKKLPGMEVDRAGNVKAMGEDVRNVMVDGKEFFGNDPKVATKNVPAHAIKKVQVYDKKSDEAEFTGINDGERDKTVNLVLKDDKKNGTFGDISAGLGTGEHYKAGAKAFRFTNKDQVAALGMLNNINQFGFSFDDYLNFGGGLGGIIMGGGGGSAKIELNTDNSFPVNFGQTITGLVTSGAGGFNYSHQVNKTNRFNISYMGNGSDRNSVESVYSKNFIPQGYYTQQENRDEFTVDRSHRINFGWKNQLDSTLNFNLSGVISLGTGKSNGNILTESQLNDSLVNRLTSITGDNSSRLTSGARASAIKKMNGNRTVLKISGSGYFSHDLSKTEWQNVTRYFTPDYSISSLQNQENLNNLIRWSAATSVTQKIKGPWYLQPEISTGSTNETLERTLGYSLATPEMNDSLSPVFERKYQWVRPLLEIKRITDKTQFVVQLKADLSRMSNSLDKDSPVKRDIFYFTPEVSWEKQLRAGHRLSLGYQATVNSPTASQLLPVSNTINPLSVFFGNRNLKPEYSHDLNVGWILFDQFSFTSVFLRLNGGFTKDKINWSRTVNDSLGQTNTLMNVTSDYNAGASFDFSTPIRKLGITVHASLREDWNRGLSLVNGIENINTNLSHKATLSVDNRKKEKWDINAGATFQLTDAGYSLYPSLNNTYWDLSYFAELRFTPGEHWNFQASADVTNYNERSFNASVSVPLIGAEANYYFLKNKRGTLTASAFDLLNKNTGLQRMSELNYLRETHSNIIGRYVMFSFKYRLNKFEGNNGGITIKTGRH